MEALNAATIAAFIQRFDVAFDREVSCSKCRLNHFWCNFFHRLHFIDRTQNVETLEHLVNEGMGDNTLRALTSDLGYLEA